MPGEAALGQGGPAASQDRRDGLSCLRGRDMGWRPGPRPAMRDTGRRVGQHALRRFPGRRAAAADPAAQGGLPVPGPGEVPRIVRRRPARPTGHVHGRLPGPLGRERARRNDRRSLLADQAKLVPGRQRRPDDPPTRPAGHVRTGRLNRDRSGGASLFGKEQHGILGACRGAHAAWRAVLWTGRPPGGGSRP